MKTLIKLLVILVLGAGLLGLAASLMLPSAARVGVEKGAGSALGVGATLVDVNAGIGPSNTEFGLEGLALQNPEGFGETPLLDIGEATVGVGTFSLLSDTIEVPAIRLDGLKLNLVQDGMKSNLGQVLDHIRSRQQGADASSPAPGGEETNEEGDAGSGGKRLAFGTVSVSGVGARLELRGIPGIEDKVQEWTAPAFEMDLSDEANRERVQSIEDLAEELLKEIAQRTLGASSDDIPPAVLQVLNGSTSLKDAGDALIEEAKGKLEQETDKLKDEAKKQIGGALEGLLGKDG